MEGQGMVLSVISVNAAVYLAQTTQSPIDIEELAISTHPTSIA